MGTAFTAPPQFTVLAGRQEIGHTDPAVLTDDSPGLRLLLLAGRSWQVPFIDWNRRRAFVELAKSGGVAKWSTPGLRGLSFELSRAMRDVYLGQDPPVELTRRARTQLADIRTTEGTAHVRPDGTVVHREGDRVRWWTWASFRANATLAASLPGIVDPTQRPNDTAGRRTGGGTGPPGKGDLPAPGLKCARPTPRTQPSGSPGSSAWPTVRAGLARATNPGAAYGYPMRS